MPVAIHSLIDSELNQQVSTGQSLSVADRTVTLPVTFDSLSYITDLSDDDRKKYANKTFIYRFTRFNNGNTKDVILVEELAGNVINENLSEEEKNNIALIFAENNLSFIEPDADASSADTELRSKLGKAGAAEIDALHAKAYLPLTDVEKEAILTSVSKFPESVLKDIKGLKFGKKYCKLDDNDKTKGDFPNAYYSTDDHEVVLVNAGTNIVDNLFGEKNSDFISRLEFTVLHEVGHAVDYAPYRKDKDDLFNPMYEKENKIEEQEAIFNANKSKYNRAQSNKKITEINLLKTDYKSYIKNLNGNKFVTSSGSGKQINVTGNSISFTNIAENNNFNSALKLDSPNITVYSDKNVKEAYAESFALYISESESLKTLSPNVYEYFNSKYPQ